MKKIKLKPVFKILIAGSGGQGVMSLGRFLAGLAVRQGKYVTWMPSYGAEMRGGSAYCFVKVSSGSIDSPVIDKPDIGIIFNDLSFKRFFDNLKGCSTIIINSDLVKTKTDLLERNGLIKAPLNRMAIECGDIKVANTLVLGMLSSLGLNFLSSRQVSKLLNSVFPNKEILNKNYTAFIKGRRALSGI